MVPGMVQDALLAPEPGKRPDADDTDRGSEEGGIGPGHHLPQSAHLPHVKGAGGVIDAPGTEEEERLEESVIEQMEHAHRHTQPQTNL